jgi:SDR family mycofactocin-dependent oxidoreductase
MGSLDGKVALISGAARGQGRSHAIRLAQEGADIIAFDRCTDAKAVNYPLGTESELNETVLAIEALGRKVVAEKVDARDTSGLKALMSAGERAFGRLDIVVANAGVIGLAPVLDVDDDLWDEVVGTNLTGVFRTVRAALPTMLAGGRGGSIILTASTAGVQGHANTAPYAAAKHGVVGLTRVLANEFGAQWIRANAVVPSSVGTGMIFNQEMYTMMTGGDPEATREQAEAGFRSLNVLPVPWVETQDISNAVAWLASDQARYVTGALFAIDAGATAR